MARTLPGNTYEVIIHDRTDGRFKFFLTLAHDDNHRLQHVELHAAKAGTTINGVMTSLERAINLAIRDDDVLGEVITDMMDQTFSPRGPTEDPDIPTCESLANYIAQRIVLDGYFVPPVEEAIV